MQENRFSASTSGTLYVLSGSVCISFAPLFVRFVDVGPTAVAFYRLLFGCIALFGVAIFRGDRLLPGKSVLLLTFLAALFFTFDLACWHQAIMYIGPGLATILANFQVFLLALIGVVFLREPMGLRLGLSIPLAFIGLWLLLDVNPADMPEEMTAGLVLGLCTAAFYTGYILTLRGSQRLVERLPAVSNMAVISLIGLLFSGALALFQGQSLAIPGAHDTLLLMLYGVGCQGLGWFLLSKGLPHLPASRAGLLMLAQPALSFIWDVLLLGRPTSLLGYCGAAMALAAISLGVLGSGARQTPAIQTAPRS